MSPVVQAQELLWPLGIGSVDLPEMYEADEAFDPAVCRLQQGRWLMQMEKHGACSYCSDTYAFCMPKKMLPEC